MTENKTEKELEKQRKTALDNFSAGMLNLAIDGINEAVAKKQVEVDYWRNKAYILANEKWQCIEHGGQSVEELEEHIEKVKCSGCFLEN